MPPARRRLHRLARRTLMVGTLGSLLGAFPVGSASADPLAPPEAAALTTRLLDGKVWLVHAVIVRVTYG
jgi:hypothetical protein